ncbi:cell division protein DedD [Apirhabdus apintestini]|nr:cell division protein DedD [Enterobacteriaceae bacterium CA-0114]
MASKFQNRLVGTIVLVAVGLSCCRGCWTGKKHYKDEFAAIPLVPKPGDKNEQDMLPPVSQSLPSQPPEGAAEEIRASNAAGVDASRLPEMAGERMDDTPVNEVSTPAPKPQPKSKPQVQPQQKPAPKPENKPQPAPPPAPKPQVKDIAPAGSAWVIQLGALKNADKANEIVAKLRGAGYRAYTIPATPVQGKINRILVGPDASRERLEASRAELTRLSGGLSGVVKNIPRNSTL